MNTGKWCYSFNGENFEGVFDYKEGAINEAKCNISEDDGSVIYIGQVKDISFGVPIDWLLDQLREEAYEQAGEVSQDFMMYVNKEHRYELENQLNNVLHDWMKKYNYEPNFWTVENIEEFNRR
ncbi:hypothetical protein PQ478_08915 [Alkalihalophilus pseudofirmus]|uniref:hypothetical protein n=1 Tax=Alkalihalophilus pseudofirmus TaxID=79885 RepID=UPI00259BA5C6|nr:hypothetical protein [Alkalihalophilus pseudofirmus]WEG18591.1 hypothetical protein PQ478_08915 [Alkalihalophilus pseudofirmus]